MVSVKPLVWSFVYGEVHHEIPIEIAHLLSENKFDSEGEISTSKQISQFIQSCILNHVSDEFFICKIFTLTFEGLVKA